MVLAGPGSGKTLVITHRIRYLIEQLHIPPEEILVITFTRAAANQMKERFLSLTKEERTRVNFGTFHAIFFHILKYAYHYSVDNILREDQKYQILMELADQARLEYEDPKEIASSLAAEISVVKNERIPLEHYYSTSYGNSTFRDIYRGYERRLHELNRIDFDDMLVYTYELFTKRQDILAQWQKHFRYILVDEFQDINALQYSILKMLAKEENNLFVVGDDDQSIYRFRGAKPEIMLGFEKDYPGARILHLQENYRCSGAIGQTAGYIIQENRLRFPKQISCVNAEGEKVDIRCYRDMKDEAIDMIRSIQKTYQRNASYRQIAILTRTNTGGRYIAERLMEYEIPFCMTDTVPNLYDHWIAQDLIAYIHLGMGLRDRGDFLRIMNHPLRYISRDTVDQPQVDFDRLRLWYEDKPWMVKRLDTLEEDLHTIGGLRPYSAISYIRGVCSYDSYISEYAEQRKIEKAELLEIADEIQEGARSFKSFREWFEHLDAYRLRLEEQKRNRQKGKSDEDAVVIMTLHSAKGLEFDEVFLPDLNDGNLPHRKASLQTDLEEERRLLYVGMTRAKRLLHMSYLKERFGKEQHPSQFLEVLGID